MASGGPSHVSWYLQCCGKFGCHRPCLIHWVQAYGDVSWSWEAEWSLSLGIESKSAKVPCCPAALPAYGRAGLSSHEAAHLPAGHSPFNARESSSRCRKCNALSWNYCIQETVPELVHDAKTIYLRATALPWEAVTSTLLFKAGT